MSITRSGTPGRIPTQTSQTVGANLGLGSAISAASNTGGYSTSGGVKNAYTATPTPASASYVAGMSIDLLMATTTNDAASTLAVSGMGTKPIVTKANAALSGGELVNGTLYHLTYDGTSFRILA